MKQHSMRPYSIICLVFFMVMIFLLGGCSEDSSETSEAKKFTVSYVGNGGSPVPSDASSYTTGQTVTVDSGSTILRSGYTFTGWTNATGASVGGSFVMGEKNVVLYASWNVAHYSVTYVGNSVISVPTDSNTYTMGSVVTIANSSTVTVSDSNLTFTGWTNSAGQVVSGTVVMGSANLVLYASWKARFVDNGDGTITDNDNNLMWFKDCRVTGTGGSTFHEMLNFCATTTQGGHSDWRLPEVSEYQTLINTSYTPININTNFFSNVSTSRYLSLTKWYGLVNYRWYVAFYPTSNETLNTNATSTNSKWYFIPVRTIN